MRQVFCLQWADYDCSDHHYLLAPEGATEESFKELCNSLLKEAADLACNKYQGFTWGGLQDEVEKDQPTWVGWSNLVHILAYELLPKHGYEYIRLPTVTYVGTSIIRDAEYDDREKLLKQEVLDIIVQHNEKVEKFLNDHRELRKAASAEAEASAEPQGQEG